MCKIFCFFLYVLFFLIFLSIFVSSSIHLCARSGLTIFWRRKFEVPGDDCMYPLIVHAGDVKKITVTHMIGSLQVLGVGLFFSLIILIIELIYWLCWLLPKRRKELMQQLAQMYESTGTSSSLFGSSQVPQSLNDMRLSAAEQQILLANTMASTGFIGWLRRWWANRNQKQISSLPDRQKFISDVNQRTGTAFRNSQNNYQWNNSFNYPSNLYGKSNATNQLKFRAKMHGNQFNSQYSNMYSNLSRDYGSFAHHNNN